MAFELFFNCELLHNPFMAGRHDEASTAKKMISNVLRASVGVFLRITEAFYHLFSNWDFIMPYFVIFCETGIITRINC